MTGNLELGTSWGPFSPVYLGISHILDASLGTMADFPLFVGRREPASNILPENAFDYVQSMNDGDRRATVLAVPEDVSPDYSSYSLRYYLDPHGDTARAQFTVDEGRERMRCDLTFRNTSDTERAYYYSLGLTIADPRKKVRLKDSLRPCWIPARNYKTIDAFQKAFALGCRQCLTRVFTWGVEEQVLGQAFGGWPGDRVAYRTKLPRPLQQGFIYFRFIRYGAVHPDWELSVNGQVTAFRFPQTWAIPGGGWGKNRDTYEEWRLLRVPIGALRDTDVDLELRPLNPPGNDTARIWLDGMLLSEGRLPGDEGNGDLVSTAIVDELLQSDAHVKLETASEAASTFQFHVPNSPIRRATVASNDIATAAGSGSGSFVDALRDRFHLPPARLHRDAMMVPWGIVESAPIVVEAGSEKTVSFTVAFDAPMEGVSLSRAPKATAASGPIGAPRGPYAEMISRMRDVLLFNVNYPMNLTGTPSPFYVPAKYFPIPYSWDGGFAAVGLATFAPDLALQEARYFMADEDQDVPFLYCGSPLPTPIYALWDVYQSSQDRQVLASSYAGAKRMHDFYLGRTPGSTVNAGNDGLLSTYAYNYNLGIDDHPIQRWAEECQLTNKGLYSLILMAQVLRVARIMRNIANLLGHEADVAQYTRDIEVLSTNIEDRMWDEESGLYGWLCRDHEGTVARVVLDECAGDRSACAFLPLFAGLTGRKDRLIAQMMDPARFRTPFGISSVDMSAPSYNPRGYWNGGIWPVMQWYLWRGLLEAGEPALARELAETILRTWQTCYERDHYLGEHFMIEQARMNGAPNFGGLSAVLLPMHTAYFAPYQVTTCYDVIILNQKIDHANDMQKFVLGAPFQEAASSTDILVNMGRTGQPYEVLVNGEILGNFESDEVGHFFFRLPCPSGEMNILVKPESRVRQI